VTGPRVVSGTVTDLSADTVTVLVGVDPDTGEALTVVAAIPRLDGVAHVVVGDHGAVALGGQAGAPFRVEFATYADLRDGITVVPTRGSDDAP
jgi:hypothetical protein